MGGWVGGWVGGWGGGGSGHIHFSTGKQFRNSNSYDLANNDHPPA